jgi:ankyrin repeat protein
MYPPNGIERTFHMNRHLKFTALLLLSLVSACRTGEQMGGNEEIFAVVKYDNRHEVTRLLAAGADINARDNNGETPLTFATKSGNNQVAKVLRERGGK